MPGAVPACAARARDGLALAVRLLAPLLTRVGMDGPPAQLGCAE